MQFADGPRKRMRGKSVVWDHFKCHEEDGQGSSPTGGKARPAAFCSYCNLKYTFPNATKMMRHLLKCSLCPDGTKRELEQSGFGEYRADHHALTNSGSPEEDLGPPSMVRTRLSPIYQDNDSPTPGTSALSPHPSLLMVSNPLSRSSLHEPKSEHINQDVSRYDNAERMSKTDKLLARAIFCTGMPISILESGQWQELFRHLQPSYALPSKEVLLGTLLETEYMATSECVSSELNKTPFVAVLAHSRQEFDEGYRSVKEQANLVITNPKSLFLDRIATGEHENTSDIAEAIAGVIATAEHSQVLIVVTDLKPNVRNSWETLSTRFPNTTFSGNPVEGLSDTMRCILAQDSVQNMLTRASKVCKFGNCVLERCSSAMSSLVQLSSVDSDRNINHGKFILALEILLENKKTIQDSVDLGGQNVDVETREIILNSVFWETVSFMVIVWRNVHIAKANLEREAIRLSEVAVEILQFENVLQDAVSASPLVSSERSAILTAMKSSKEACLRGIHYAAYLVDPRFSGGNLSERDKSSAIQYIVEFSKRIGQDCGRVIANLGEYRAKDGDLWSKQYVWDAASHVAPATWWRGISDAQPLSPIAAGILCIAATSSMSAFEPGDHDESLNRDQAKKVMFVLANNELSQQANTRPDMIVLSGGY